MITAVVAAAMLLVPISPSVVSGEVPPIGPSGLPVVAPPAPDALAWLLYDDTNQVMLASFNIDEPRAPASVTKIMTALVARDNAELDEIVTISESAAEIGEAEVGLAAGEQWTLWELLNAIVVRSGNDAAIAIAEHIGGSIEGFSAMMNTKARALGMTNSNFANPHGLDAEGHVMSARDILTLGRAALADPVISRLARTQVVKFRPDPEGVARRAENTNELLAAYPGVIGIKTGFTNQAGRVLLSSAERYDRRFIAVVMGTEDHFAATRPLLEYAFDTHRPADLVRVGLVEEQGGGAGPPVRLAQWFRVRLNTMAELNANAGERAPTPTERALTDRFADLLPALVGSSA